MRVAVPPSPPLALLCCSAAVIATSNTFNVSATT